MFPFTQLITSSKRQEVLDAVESIDEGDTITINNEEFVVRSVDVDPPHSRQTVRVTFNTPTGKRTLVLHDDVVDDAVHAAVVEHCITSHDTHERYAVGEVVIGGESFQL